ncbi:cbb3-type cytochrome oxidase assembly protein CcoS [Leptospira sp. 2 VSF19]|uniref:Cbb3-type cytochrome oxidase assembly protein CcoS n=1 Tax=Leptospira soteropolitanensis TaxID=2950025 RepID=A0AAW5VF26_9LEPT|nr:cbb3-type cytochrome oxidase assembly protein [Leptospira soteropolitanensis]MCW7492760.1 cbb3-type cytochrome oxidase assembly protein CcoS [Leptospira soteropolitanensis]MCW7500443.1 cbb3-type cytochrome oxidase assembly protein CcoS [Leptospira soteropolitanensis]MCW7522522.1 cbb3-type cytochrome oxidase assembly protein CcoS [Leptospira soteropolitanensis]MCW7526378.1 cbb3-type cytochrome oxidase assembly protein CcoS [Leptospira soteropolitanensis]MCW7530413.1 cbb3-type cytochrome oxid
MEALYLTIPMAMCIAAFFLYVFITAFRKGQFEDIESPKYRMFFEEEYPQESQSKSNSSDGPTSKS